MLPILDIWLSEILLLKKSFSCLKIFLTKNENMGLKAPFWGNLEGNCNVLSTNNLVYLKYAKSVKLDRKLQPPVPPTF